MNIVLIGLRATGKTVIGARLAQRLNVQFFDTDALISEATGRTVKQIVEEEGWGRFREAEREAIQGLADKNFCIIALGGGAVMDKGNVEALGGNAFFIWLQADMENIIERMNKDSATVLQRPPLSGKDPVREVSELLKTRSPVYSSLADWAIDTSKGSLGEIIGEIIRAIKDGIIPWKIGRNFDRKERICREIP
jgi:shikimate kinase